MAGRIIDVTMQLIDKVTSPLSTISTKLQDSGKQWQRAGREITKTGDSIAKVGSSMTAAVTMPLVGAGAGCLTLAANFEAGMSKVQAISGASGEEMDSLNQKAMEMGAKTKFSATEAADAFSYMAMAGWKTEQMMSGIEGVMYLAGATGEDLAATSDIVTDAMTAFGMAADGTSRVLKDGVEVEVSNVQRFTDVLAATANNANTNVAMLGESFQYVAPVAGSLGYSVEDVSVALGTMANSGIKASQSGTALRTLLTNMAHPTDTMASAMETLGVSLDDGEGNMKSFSQVMADLRAGFGDLKMSQDDINAGMDYWNGLLESGQATEDEYNAGMQALMENALGAEGAMKAEAAAMLAGKTGMAGLLAIVNASDDDFDGLTEAINNSNGACKNMYDITQNNLQGRLTVLKSTLESIGISLGNQLIPYVEKATKFIQGLADKFNALDDSQKAQIVKWAAIAAAVGPALLVFGKVVSTVGKVVSVVGRIGSAIKAAGSVMALLTGPGAIVVAVLAAICVVAALVITHWDQVKAAGQALLQYLSPVFEHLQEKWSELCNKIQQMWASHIQPAWDNFKNKVTEVWNLIKPYLEQLGHLYEEVFKVQLKLAIDVAVEVFDFLASTVGTIVETILDVLGGFIDFVVGVFTGDWERAWNGIGEIFSSIWDGIKSVAQAAFDFIGGLVGGLVDAWNGLLSIIGLAKDKGSEVSTPGHNATGTSYWGGGPTWVNERGAEIIDLPKGSRIYPHSESLKMAYNEGAKNGLGRGGSSINITIPKLADNISVRNDTDIDAIATAIANKLERTAQNLGGGELGYIY